MKRFSLIVLATLIAICVKAQSYPYEWLALGSTEDMSTTQVVSWRTDVSLPSAVAQIASAMVSPNISPSAATVAVSSELRTDYGLQKYYHKAVFDGLKPSSVYLYRIGDGKGNWSEWFELRTAGAKTDSFSFIFMADVQSGIMDQYPRVIRQAYRTAPDASFIVFTGDLTERALNEQYNEFFNAHGFILAEKPMVAVPDNHEYPFDANGKRAVLGTFWDHMFCHPHNSPERLDSKGFFCFDYQDCRFVMVNTREFDEFTPEEKEVAFGWVEDQLKNNPCKWLVVAQHRPVYSVAHKRKENKDMLRKKALYEKYGVDLVISGHDHVYSRTATKDGKKSTVPVCVTSVGGSGQYAPAYKMVHDRIGSDSEFFQVVSVSEKSLLFCTYDALGNLYDSFRIDAKGNRKTFKDLTPAVPMRTSLPPTRRKKYDEKTWSELDSLRLQFNKVKGL